MNPVFPAIQTEIEAAAEHVGLKAGFALQGDDPALLDMPAPEGFLDSDFVVGHILNADPGRERDARHDGKADADGDKKPRT